MCCYQVQGAFYCGVEGFIKRNHFRAKGCGDHANNWVPGNESRPVRDGCHGIPHVQRAAARTVEQASENDLYLAVFVAVFASLFGTDRLQ
ncbi:hypothetical protein PB16LOC_04614 [Pectobacterium versatile]|nr:hypothetical protein PB16LOC_04614 [Pectobacterium versatile]